MAFDWTQTSPTHWERSLGGMEEYLAIASNTPVSIANGRQQYTIFSALKLNLTLPNADTEASLRHAWKQLRHEQPQVAITININAKKMSYDVPDESALEEWLSSTFIVSPVSSADGLYRTAGGITQCTLYYIPASSELVFRAPHAHIDGMGTIHLWDSYLSALAAPVADVRFGDEYVRLAPTVPEILGKTAPPTEEEVSKASAKLLEYVTKLPAIGTPSRVGRAASFKECRTTELVLSVETTSAIIAVCKKRGISVTSAVHAAYISTIARHPDLACDQSRYTTISPFSLRPYLPPPYNTRHYAAVFCYTPVPFNIEMPTSFSEVANALNKSYRTSLKDHPEFIELTGPYTHMVAQLVQSPEGADAPIPTDAMVSSLGIIENNLKRSYGDAVKVTNFKMAIDVVYGMSAMHVFTFGGQLRAVYSSNDGYEDPSQIETYLAEIEDILNEELLSWRRPL
ncbi:hypothetical protein BJX65DRAFT_84882 [Aspergillus insuetus]